MQNICTFIMPLIFIATHYKESKFSSTWCVLYIYIHIYVFYIIHHHLHSY